MPETDDNSHNIDKKDIKHLYTSDYLYRPMHNVIYNYNYLISRSENMKRTDTLEERIHNLENHVKNLEEKIHQIEKINKKLRDLVSKSINLFLKVVLIPALVLTLIVCILVNLTNMTYVNIVSTGLSVTIILLVIAFLIELKRLICKYTIQ